jgi:hypothetical protein
MGEVTSEPDRWRQASPARGEPGRAVGAPSTPLPAAWQALDTRVLPRAVQTGRLAPAAILSLQRTLGNRVVRRLLADPTARQPVPALQRFAETDVQTRAYYIWEEKTKQDPSRREQSREDQEADYLRARQELQTEADALVAALDQLTPASQRHINVPKHLWHLAVADPATYQASSEKNPLDPHGPSWAQVKAVMARVLQQGKMGPYKGTARLKELTVNGRSVVVTYVKIGPVYRVSDGWVAR